MTRMPRRLGCSVPYGSRQGRGTRRSTQTFGFIGTLSSHRHDFGIPKTDSPSRSHAFTKPHRCHLYGKATV